MRWAQQEPRNHAQVLAAILGQTPLEKELTWARRLVDDLQALDQLDDLAREVGAASPDLLQTWKKEDFVEAFVLADLVASRAWCCTIPPPGFEPLSTEDSAHGTGEEGKLCVFTCGKKTIENA